MANKDVPQCTHCFGRNWVNIGVLNGNSGICLWQCGHGPAGAEEMKNGCSRVIMATEEQMTKGGTI
jgi:hypothetical protein